MTDLSGNRNTWTAIARGAAENAGKSGGKRKSDRK